MIEHVCPWTPKSSARGINSRRAANQRNRVPAAKPVPQVNGRCRREAVTRDRRRRGGMRTYAISLARQRTAPWGLTCRGPSGKNRFGKSRGIHPLERRAPRLTQRPQIVFGANAACLLALPLEISAVWIDGLRSGPLRRVLGRTAAAELPSAALLAATALVT